MSVHPISADSIAHAVPATTSKVVPISTQQDRRRKILNGLIDALCEVIALGGTAVRALVASRVHDARADRHVTEIDRLAARMAVEADAIGDTVTLRRAVTIRQHVVGYRRADNDGEDREIETARAAVERLCEIGRGLNRRLTLELAKRASRKGAPS